MSSQMSLTMMTHLMVVHILLVDRVQTHITENRINLLNDIKKRKVGVKVKENEAGVGAVIEGNHHIENLVVNLEETIDVDDLGPEAETEGLEAEKDITVIIIDTEGLPVDIVIRASHTVLQGNAVTTVGQAHLMHHVVRSRATEVGTEANYSSRFEKIFDSVKGNRMESTANSVLGLQGMVC